MLRDEHSRLGASRAYRFMNCAGSVALCATLSALPATEFMREGTAAHKLAYLCLNDGHDPEDFVSRFVNSVEVSPEMADAVRIYTEEVARQQGLSIHAETFLEHKFSLARFDPELSGTNDSAVYLPDLKTLHVNDYKHGAGQPVEVENNEQLRYYGLGALLLLISQGKDVERVVTRVIQPRCAHPDGPIREFEYSALELLEFGFELREAAEATRAADPSFKTGPWCNDCDAAGACETLHGCVQEQVNSNEDLNRLSRDELAERLKLADLCKSYARGVRRFAYREAQRGRVATGYKLVATKGRVVWADSQEALSMALIVFADEVAESDLYKQRPITPKQFLNLVGEHAETFLARYATKKRSVSLVPLSDDREAVQPALLSEFEDILGDEDGE